MVSEQKTIVIFIVLIFGGIFYAISCSQAATGATLRILIETRNQLSTYLIVEDGIIESPAVIIILYTYNEFTAKIDELNTDQIYRYSLSFYVFESGYTRAWKYTPTIKQDGWNIIWPKFVRGN